MEKIVPNKLKPGDEIRVIAPARSLKIIGQDSREIARKRFEEAGLKVTFGRNTTDENCDLFASAAVEKRLEDLHEAFADKRVKAIFTVIGGANSNMLLPYIDYELIKQNPKVFCGFSDITALLNGIYAKTGMVTFRGRILVLWECLRGRSIRWITCGRWLWAAGRMKQPLPRSGATMPGL